MRVCHQLLRLVRNLNIACSQQYSSPSTTAPMPVPPWRLVPPGASLSTCPPNLSGLVCENCAANYWGPDCTSCPMSRGSVCGGFNAIEAACTPTRDSALVLVDGPEMHARRVPGASVRIGRRIAPRAVRETMERSVSIVVANVPTMEHAATGSPARDCVPARVNPTEANPATPAANVNCWRDFVSVRARDPTASAE